MKVQIKVLYISRVFLVLSFDLFDWEAEVECVKRYYKREEEEHENDIEDEIFLEGQ
jgi:hypothetical protein